MSIGANSATTAPRVASSAPRTYLPRVADGEHSFVPEEIHPGVTRLTQREEFTGVIVPFASGLLAGMDEEFAAVNAALARRVEAVRGSVGPGR